MFVYFILMIAFICFSVLICFNKFFPSEYNRLENDKLKKIYKYGSVSFTATYALSFLFLGIYDTVLNHGGYIKALMIIGVVLFVIAVVLTVTTYVYFTLEKRNYRRFALKEKGEK